MALHLGTNWNCNSNKARLQPWNLIGFVTMGSFWRQKPKLKTCSYKTGKHIKWSCDIFWCKFSAVFESELTETSVVSGNKIKEISGCPGRDWSDSDKRKKGSRGISSCNAQQGTGQQWFMPDLVYCWELLHNFFLFLPFLWQWEENMLSHSVWKATAVGAAWPEEGGQEQVCFHCSLPDALVQVESSFPGNGCVLCKKITKKNVFRSPPLTLIHATEKLWFTYWLSNTWQCCRSPGVTSRCWNGLL